MGFFEWLKSLFFGASSPRPSSGQLLDAINELGATMSKLETAVAEEEERQSKPPKPPPRPKSLEGLELGLFAPMSGDEIRSQTSWFGGLFANPWFGRRDLIPPVTDKRTELIDRGMVGVGLITSEELIKIHQVGAEMDLVRPDLALAGEIARQTVARSEEERKRIKEQKKAEAAERKRQHAEKVALRKRTDIVFLGRGVSKGLADRKSNIERLAELHLPIMATPGDVAQAMGITIPQLRWLAFHAETATRTHYVTFSVPKKSGGTRQLAAPHRKLRAAQEWILANILSKVRVHDAAHGFVPGRSTLTNAVPHVGKSAVLNADLENFFPTITFSRIKGAFRWLGYSPAVATILALLCTEAPRQKIVYDRTTYFVAMGKRSLPQGACTSPALSNLVSRRLDKRLAGLAAKLGWSYTRYADDVTLSGNGEAAKQVGYVMARLRHIAQEEGFAVNEKKTRVQRQSTRQSVTGVVVNERPGAPRPLVRRIRAILHRARREGLKAQNRRNIPHFESWLAGIIAYISMLNAEQGRRLKGDFEALFPAG
jgi:retron-type reverse transcriptase